MSILTATAASLHADVKPMVQLAISGGGDTLNEAHDADGDTTSLTAGAGVSIEIGLDMQLTPTVPELSTQAFVGYKYDSVEATNGDVDFSRITLNILESYRIGKIKLGGGLTYHLNPTYSEDIDHIEGEFNYDNALGGIIQVGYEVDPTVTIGLRAMIINYEKEGTTEEKNGNSFGIFANYTF